VITGTIRCRAQKTQTSGRESRKAKAESPAEGGGSPTVAFFSSIIGVNNPSSIGRVVVIK
jgi:hypothetical protein